MLVRMFDPGGKYILVQTCVWFGKSNPGAATPTTTKGAPLTRMTEPKIFRSEWKASLQSR